ncbi:hypothetical protein PILCRDRAFT_828173 [Piloderma croceum F 1598]|uniref:Uncharacterized protein n=1 Tax=Piloderma croceum (strain F 1598) TaxID=765440 RepID=A0A0C3F309_PILCF|nr:hypothetical protein PILCRDRAFT_828173 [Piloderma croceum F 1598]
MSYPADVEPGSSSEAFYQFDAVTNAKHCSRCQCVMGPDWERGMCGDCERRDGEKAKEHRCNLKVILARQASDTAGSSCHDIGNMPLSSRAPSLLSSRCVSCTDILPSRDIRMDKLPICRGCRRSEAANPQVHQGAASPLGALTHGMPVPTSDPLPHYSLRVRSSMPHYNSKGELIKYSNTQPSGKHLPRSSSPYIYLPAGNVPRMCCRYGCGVVLPPDNTGKTCEKCSRLGFTPFVPSSAPPSHALPTPTSVTSPTWPNFSLAKAPSMVSSGRGRAVMHGGVSMSHRPKGPVPLRPKVAANDNIIVTDLDAELDLVLPKRLRIPERNESTNPTIPKSPIIEIQTDSHHVRSKISSSSQPAASRLKPAQKYSCETQGCENLVPLDTKWPRCTSCSLKRWRTRLQSNHTQAENSPKSERRKISKIRKARVMTKSIKADNKKDANSIPGWDSDLTELSFSEEEAGSGENESDEYPDKKGARSGFKIRIPAVSDRQSQSTTTTPVPNPWTGPTRICVRQNCNTILLQSYRWKLCDSCRAQAREYQRKRLALASASAYLAASEGGRDVRDHVFVAPLPSQPALAPQAAARLPEYQICNIDRCHNLIPPPDECHFRTCQSCRDQMKSGPVRRSVVHSQGGDRVNDGDMRRGLMKRKRERSMSCESEEGMAENGYFSPALRLADASSSNIPVALSSSLIEPTSVSPVLTNTTETPRMLSPIERPAISSSAESPGVVRGEYEEQHTPIKKPSIVSLSSVSQPTTASDSSPTATLSSPSKKDIPPLFTHTPLTNTHTPASKSNVTRIPNSTSRTPRPTAKSKFKLKASTLSKSLPLRISTPTPAYPPYQNLIPLAYTFRVRLDSFLDTFRLWFRAHRSVEVDENANKTSNRPDHSGVNDGSIGIEMDDVPPTSLPSSKPTHTDTPIVFGFEGEYSIISVRETVSGKLGIEEMWKRIGRIVKEMERVTELRFNSASSFTIKTGGVLVRLRCLHNVLITSHGPCSSLNNAGSSLPEPATSTLTEVPAPPHSIVINNDAYSTTTPTTATTFKPQIISTTKTKTMVGELEVAIVPDRSHRFFVGQRTIVRFRLVG